MLKSEALEAVFSDPTVDSYRVQLKAIGSPVDDLIDDVIGKHLTGTKKRIVDAVIKALRAELAKYSETKPTTLWGRIGRIIASIFGK